jgi:hypothetical protein
MAIKIEKEYRLVYYETLEGYEDGEYDVGLYFDDLSEAKAVAQEARIDARERGLKVLIEMQEIEWDTELGEAIEHYGFGPLLHRARRVVW